MWTLSLKNKNMTIKVKIGKELYVYMNGSLLYKRWLDQGHGIILQGDTPLGRAQGNFRSSDIFQHAILRDTSSNN